jgi:hypothetical protein
MRRDEDLIAPGKQCLPEPSNNEYQWVPWQPLDSFKIILEAEIRHRFRKCHVKQGNSDFLDRIPKKIPVKLAGNQGIVAYGLHAYRLLAWWRILAMGVIFISPGVAMLIVELTKDSKDLQTAFVVIGTTIAIFTGYFVIAVYFGVEAQET